MEMPQRNLDAGKSDKGAIPAVLQFSPKTAKIVVRALGRAGQAQYKYDAP